MKRLRDAVDREDPLFRRGVELLRRTPPAASTPDIVKTRVWRTLQRAPGPARHGLRAMVLKLAIVGAVALVAGTAGAVIAQRWIMPRLAAAPFVPAPAARPVKAAPAPIVVEAEAGHETDEIPIAKTPPRAAPRRPASPTPPNAAAVARERTEVLDALIALRRQHDPARAGALLARYLSAHPHGALREEALVLAIEAADARGDRAAGEQLARAYQAEFPAGRFLSFARSHTAPQGGGAASGH